MLKLILLIHGIQNFSYLCNREFEGRMLCALEPHNIRASTSRDISKSRESKPVFESWKTGSFIK